MAKKKPAIVKLFETHIKGSARDALVSDKKVFLCHLTYAVTKGVPLEANGVYVNTRVIKHMYDKRPAQEFDLVINQMYEIVRYPDHVYLNKDAKRGDACMVKKINGEMYFCSLEGVQNEGEEIKEYAVVTAFRLGKPEKYLKSYTLLWSWRGGTPSS